MKASKRWRLVCYDIREPARWRRVYRIVRGAGTHVQYSIFRCRLDDREVEKLRWELTKVMSPEDALLIVDLCPQCATRVVSRNHVEGWDEVPSTFRIIGGGLPLATADQAPASVRRPRSKKAASAKESGKLGSVKTK
jgi:CRISPR-associated protein Cas2